VRFAHESLQKNCQNMFDLAGQRWRETGKKMYIFSMERGMRIMSKVQVQVFLCMKESCQQLRQFSLSVIACHA
jgi:hypothetical protein